MRYEVALTVPGIEFTRNVVVEAPDELTAAYRAGLRSSAIHTTATVLAIRSEDEWANPVLTPEPARVTEGDDGR